MISNTTTDGRTARSPHKALSLKRYRSHEGTTRSCPQQGPQLSSSCKHATKSEVGGAREVKDDTNEVLVPENAISGMTTNKTVTLQGSVSSRQGSVSSRQAARPVVDVQSPATVLRPSSFVLGQGMDPSDHEADEEEREKCLPPLPVMEPSQDSEDSQLSMEFSLQSQLAQSLSVFDVFLLLLFFAFLTVHCYWLPGFSSTTLSSAYMCLHVP